MIRVPIAGMLWWLVCGQLIPLSEWVTALFPMPRDSDTVKAIVFCVYDVPKVPPFIGFVSAGIPLGVTFSFLIAGPMVGPVGLGVLAASWVGKSP